MRLAARSALPQAALLLAAAILAGALRQLAPNGIAWTGRWPDASTSAEDAYRMIAREGDPAFASLQDAIAAHSDGRTVFLDARSTDEFKAGRIPGARNLPFYEMEQHQEALANVTSDDPLLIYCEGIGCELSFFLGRELQAAGFTNIRIFYGGFPEWKQAGLPVEP